MRKINTKGNSIVWGLMLFGILIVSVFSASILAANSYQSTLSKGTEEFTVVVYDKSAWKTTVDTSLKPNDWFEGAANITNAKSKITLKGFTTGTWGMYDVLTTIFFPELYETVTEIYTLLTLMDLQGYNETTINANYTSTYGYWYGIRSVWNFTDGFYEENPSYTDGIIILQDPSSYKTMLNDYNILAGVLNGNFAIQMAGYSFPNISTDDFLWQLVFRGFSIAEPQSEYLSEVVNELGCENVTASGTTLIFERHGLTNYTVEISYGVKGMMSSFTVKDTSGITIFQITSSNSEWIFFLILIITLASIIGLTVFIIIRKRKRQR
jgi:hypothetical protein